MSNPSVVPDAETSKLIQPGETSARRPTAIAQDHCRAWCDAWPATARCDARAQPAPDGCRVVTSVAEHADRPAPGSAAFAFTCTFEPIEDRTCGASLESAIYPLRIALDHSWFCSPRPGLGMPWGTPPSPALKH
jgi:hypothetical protein